MELIGITSGPFSAMLNDGRNPATGAEEFWVRFRRGRETILCCTEPELKEVDHLLRLAASTFRTYAAFMRRFVGDLRATAGGPGRPEWSIDWTQPGTRIEVGRFRMNSDLVALDDKNATFYRARLGCDARHGFEPGGTYGFTFTDLDGARLVSVTQRVQRLHDHLAIEGRGIDEFCRENGVSQKPGPERDRER
jgi:hypothetical protein